MSTSRDFPVGRTLNPMVSAEEAKVVEDKYGETPWQQRCNKIGAVVMLGIMGILIFAAIGFDVPPNRYADSQRTSSPTSLQPSPPPTLPPVSPPTDAPTVFVSPQTESPTNPDSPVTAAPTVSDTPETQSPTDSVTPPTGAPTDAVPNEIVQRGTAFVHLFEWTWSDIAQECVNVLGPNGVSAVQISPVTEHIDHRVVNMSDPEVGSFMPWWARYQPVSYKLNSRSGTREELIEMIATCQEVGVDIYVDILFNHMAATPTQFGNDGSAFNPQSLEYPDYDSSHFNSCDPPEIGGDDWGSNAERVRRCRLVGLPDLNHDLEYVRDRLVEHAQDLINIGVRGLRLDAGKHMYVDDVNYFLDSLKSVSPYVFSEIIDYGGEAISVLEYTPFYAITEFRYEGTLRDRFFRTNLATLEGIGESFGFVPTDKAVVFTDNHDSQRHDYDDTMNFKRGETYVLANIFMLAYPYGYPKLMSSFFFDNAEFARGPPNLANGDTRKVYNEDGTDNCGVQFDGDDQWICEHRNPKFMNMVKFRAFAEEMEAYEVTNWWTNNFQAIAFSRSGSNGSAAFILINKEDFEITNTWRTDLADGDYCDVLSQNEGEAVNGCEGNIVSVVNGELTTTVSAFSALAIYGLPN